MYTVYPSFIAIFITMSNIQNIQTEVDARYLYSVLAAHEEDATVKHIFEEMSDIEHGHAVAFMARHGIAAAQMPAPSMRARITAKIGKVLGYDYILGILLSTEKTLSASIMKARQKNNSPSSVSDTAHVAILENILNRTSDQKVTGSMLARFEKRHRSVGGNALRAAVL